MSHHWNLNRRNIFLVSPWRKLVKTIPRNEKINCFFQKAFMASSRKLFCQLLPNVCLKEIARPSQALSTHVGEVHNFHTKNFHTSSAIAVRHCFKSFSPVFPNQLQSQLKSKWRCVSEKEVTCNFELIQLHPNLKYPQCQRFIIGGLCTIQQDSASLNNSLWPTYPNKQTC